MQIRTIKRFILLLALPASALLLINCGGSDSSPAPVIPPASLVPVTPVATDTLSSLWDRKLSTCAALCHNPTGSQKSGPDFSTKAGFVAVVGKTAVDVNWDITERTSDCDSTPIITATDPNKSTLMASLAQSYSDNLTASANCNSSFNVHATNAVTLPSTDAIITDLASWITKGALNN